MKRIRILALTGAALLSAGVFTPVRAAGSGRSQAWGRSHLLNEWRCFSAPRRFRRLGGGRHQRSVVDGRSDFDRPNSRAELQFDSANMLRIGGNAEIHLAQLEDRRYQMELARGTVTFRVLRPSEGQC